METTARSVPEEGQLVGGRTRRWVVREVKPSALPAPALKPVLAGSQTLLTLLLAGDDNAGLELQAMRASEPGAHNIPKATLQTSARGGPPHHLGGVP